MPSRQQVEIADLDADAVDEMQNRLRAVSVRGSTSERQRHPWILMLRRPSRRRLAGVRGQTQLAPAGGRCSAASSSELKSPTLEMPSPIRNVQQTFWFVRGRNRLRQSSIVPEMSVFCRAVQLISASATRW